MTKLTEAQRRVLQAMGDGFLRRVWVHDRRRYKIFEVLVWHGYIEPEFAFSTGYATDFRITQAGRAALQQSVVGEGEG